MLLHRFIGPSGREHFQLAPVASTGILSLRKFAVQNRSPFNFNVSAYSPLRRPTPDKVVKPVNFMCQAPQAQSVSLVGDFNGWNSLANPMRKMPDGAWMATVQLKHGHHRYAFLVDGQSHLDPRAQGIARNDHNERVSLIAVS